MKHHHHQILPITGGPTGQPLINTLARVLSNQYELKSEPEMVNYHQVFAVVVGDDQKAAGSAWKLAYEKGRLSLIGGREDELQPSAAKELSSPSAEFISKLDKDSQHQNENWRKLIEANAAKAAKSHSRGAVISINSGMNDIARNNNAKLGLLIITDGQKNLAYTDDGGQVRLPKLIKKVSQVVPGYPAVHSQSIASRDEQALSSILLVNDAALNHPDKPLYAYPIQSKSAAMREDSQGLLIKAGGELIGSISGNTNMNVAIEAMTEQNLKRGFDVEVVRKPIIPSISIDQGKLSRVIAVEAASQVKAMSPSPPAAESTSNSMGR